MMRGVVYVAYGPNARREAIASIASLWQYNDLSVAVVSRTELAIEGIVSICYPTKDEGDGLGDIPLSRWAKLNLNKLAPKPWDCILYLDADTRVRGDISNGFKFIEDGFDLAIAASSCQGVEAFHHVEEEERQLTFEAIPFPMQFQAGVFFWHRERCGELFRVWREEWLNFKGQDQAALVRALEQTRPRVMLLGSPWNGGELVEHRFGYAR